MRAVSVKVNDVVAVAGFVTPGTRVDVLLTGNPAGSGEAQTTTVLENVAVIAAGQRLERNAAGEAQTAPVITLLVSPDDAQKVTLASSQGHIQLTLRNPVDTKQEDINATKANTLYKNVSAPAPAPPPRPSIRVKKPTVVQPSQPDVYEIKIYKGTKEEEKKFPDQPGAH
jgi:pilus assembly protein CpaB